MIYTIGYKLNYDKWLETAFKSPLKKLGLCPEKKYKGGSVWKTKDEVISYLEKNQPRLSEYDVYGIISNWKTGTYQHKDEPFRRLISTSEIVRL